MLRVPGSPTHSCRLPNGAPPVSPVRAGQDSPEIQVIPPSPIPGSRTSKAAGYALLQSLQRMLDQADPESTPRRPGRAASPESPGSPMRILDFSRLSLNDSLSAASRRASLPASFGINSQGRLLPPICLPDSKSTPPRRVQDVPTINVKRESP